MINEQLTRLEWTGSVIQQARSIDGNVLQIAAKRERTQP